MGEHMHRFGAIAIVAGFCNSACSMALLGAARVYIDSYDEISVHRSSVDEQWVFDGLDRYATRMGSPDYAELSWATPHDSKRKLSLSEIAMLYRMVE